MADEEKGAFETAFDKITSRIGEEPPEGAKGKKVDYDRFFDANQRAKGAVTGLGDLKKLHTSTVADLNTKHNNEIKALKETTATTVGQLQAGHAEDLIFSGAGVDAVGRGVIRTAWQAQPEATRPKSSALWYQEQQEAVKAHTEDPDKNKAPEFHPSVAPLFQVSEKVDEKDTGSQQRRRAPGPGGKPRKGTAQAAARGKGRLAMAKAIREDRGY